MPECASTRGNFLFRIDIFGEETSNCERRIRLSPERIDVDRDPIVGSVCSVPQLLIQLGPCESPITFDGSFADSEDFRRLGYGEAGEKP